MAKKARSFEESLYRLEEIVEALEGDEATLSESIKLYEEGTKLAKVCREELEKAEIKVTKLRSSEDGTDEEEEFAVEF